MAKSILDYTQNTEREILMHVIPRVDNLENEIERQDKRQDKLETSISDLRQDLVETETRLSNRVDERFDKVDAHLSAQDERLDKVVDGKRRWPDGAVIVSTAASTFLVLLGIGWVTHILHF